MRSDAKEYQDTLRKEYDFQVVCVANITPPIGKSLIFGTHTVWLTIGTKLKRVPTP